MMIFMIMFALWTEQPTQYNTAMQKSAEATYAQSDLKPIADGAQEYARKKAPAAAAILPIAYSLGVKHEARLTSSKITLVPNTVTSYNANKSSGSVAVTWNF